MKILSLGAGVQSSTMALMSMVGAFEKPDYAIFADTQWEPKPVMDYLDWLESVLDFPIIRVTAGNILEESSKTGKYSAIPFFTSAGGLGRRQCSREFKTAPVDKKVRELLGLMPGQKAKDEKAEVWIGISTDESDRMKPSLEKWKTKRYPLIELGMSRIDCLKWVKQNGFPEPPRSSCVGCPFKHDREWLDLRNNHPAIWQEAIRADKEIRKAGTQENGYQFIHSSLKPLAEVEFAADSQINLFTNECEGMCGL